MGKHFTKQGIVIQCTAPYAHQQAGKIERYVCTIEEGGQVLLADSGLPMSFWGWAVLTSQYLCNRLPTSTLAPNMTPFKALTIKKPDLSHLRVWECQCFVTIPTELHTKAGPCGFEAIFVGYKEARISWIICNLKGKTHFSRDVIFNEDLSSHLAIPRPVTLTTPSLSTDLPSQPVCECMLTTAGRDFQEVIQLKELRQLEHAKHVSMKVTGDPGPNGGAADDLNGVLWVV